MKYSEQSRNLAASVVLEAAVAEAVALLRAARAGVWVTKSTIPGYGASWTLATMSGVDRRHEYQRAEAILLAAGESAELLIGRAS